jgi:hypothetical protein
VIRATPATESYRLEGWTSYYLAHHTSCIRRFDLSGRDLMQERRSWFPCERRLRPSASTDAVTNLRSTLLATAGPLRHEEEASVPDTIYTPVPRARAIPTRILTPIFGRSPRRDRLPVRVYFADRLLNRTTD